MLTRSPKAASLESCTMSWAPGGAADWSAATHRTSRANRKRLDRVSSGWFWRDRHGSLLKPSTRPGLAVLSALWLRRVCLSPGCISPYLLASSSSSSSSSLSISSSSLSSLLFLRSSLSSPPASFYLVPLPPSFLPLVPALPVVPSPIRPGSSPPSPRLPPTRLLAVNVLK